MKCYAQCLYTFSFITFLYLDIKMPPRDLFMLIQCDHMIRYFLRFYQHFIKLFFMESNQSFIDPINVLLIRSKFCETNQVLEDSIKILCNPDKVLWIHIKVLVDSIKKFEILSKLHGIFWESIKVLRESFFGSH